jgi:hypothetical protein
MSYEKPIDNLVEYTIVPALYEDVKYSSEEEFDEIKQYLIDAIKEIEYIEQYDDDIEEED